MNKTLKTVLITLAITFVILFAVVMIFGEDNSAANGNIGPQEDVSAASQAVPTEAAPASEADSADVAPVSEAIPAGNSAVKLTEETLKTALDYDVFSWNMADGQGKIEIVRTIMHVWDANGSYYDMPEEELVTYIDQSLYDQANIFEVACTAVQIDPLPFFDLLK